LLLQALRGGGVAGLAAMPRAVDREGITWMRPWLDMPRGEIAAYVRRHRLRHIEDDSNADRSFARNRLRLDVWPALTAAFAQADRALAATAAWAREAQVCAEDLARIDLAAMESKHGIGLIALESLSPERRSNALRFWLKERTGAAAAAAVVQRLLLELPGQAPAQWQLEGFTLRRYRGRLECCADNRVKTQPMGREATVLCIRRAGTYLLRGWGGRLRVRRVAAGGVPMSNLTELRLVARCGGEQFQAAPERPPRSLKKQFQALAVPAWRREGPLVYCSEQLLYVPGLGIDARAVADAGVAQASIEWLADDA
jgi:tRNA(Ile)-lysidine synthase